MFTYWCSMNGSQKIKKRERDGNLRDLWRTPLWLFRAIEVYLGVKFQVDVACNKDNAILPDFIGVDGDRHRRDEIVGWL